jgi:hypothetical protein
LRLWAVPAAELDSLAGDSDPVGRDLSRQDTASPAVLPDFCRGDFCRASPNKLLPESISKLWILCPADQTFLNRCYELIFRYIVYINGNTSGYRPTLQSTIKAVSEEVES